MNDNGYWISRQERVEIIRQIPTNSKYKAGDFYCCCKDKSFVCIVRSDVIRDEEYEWIKELALIVVSPKPAKNPRLFELTKHLVRSGVSYASILERLVQRHRTAAKRDSQMTFDFDYI
ncbi:hypothetical protein [Paenibacillus sp. GXUN7292]|uniref:hypothetical protein n=1 Tax=Paenibacillus sp. GXUN7292 TaxID=3422499 RepID=UPI003D7EAB03